MTRADGIALLLQRGWGSEELASMSDALVDWIATDTPWWHNGIRGIGAKSAERLQAMHPTEEASLVTEGRTLSRRGGHSRKTLAALANITRIGAGR